MQVLAQEVIRRLSTQLRSPDKTPHAPTPEEIQSFCDALVSSDAGASATMMSRIQAKGTSVTDIYIHYLAAAAGRLGEMWATDEISFMDVTIGASRILAILRGLRDVFRSSRPMTERAALFAAVPGEQHTIGITMAADLFRREGWDIDLIVGASHEEIIDRLGSSDASVVGLTAHGEKSLSPLLRLIPAIRIVNPAVSILICGKIGELSDDVVSLTGADGFAGDVTSALVTMGQWHDGLARSG
ncbi:cobalamin B12-binding domain-containing protein [Palleronia sp. KMU-117]|uniref:cobalamin B12-binding domain-containing protein n=1 Tax=Palleronia sp. KMU-117 TaxID=3434108 RepID=UPI003D7387C7